MSHYAYDITTTPDLRPWTPVSRYGVSPVPASPDPIEVLRGDGSAHLAVYVGGLWREADRQNQTLNLLHNPISFWRSMP